MEKKRVLVVDDEEDFLKMVKLNLEETGKYEVMGLSNAKDVLFHVHAFKPDVVLLDILMPKMSGIEACEELNKDSMSQKVPIIILSVLDRDQDKLSAYKVGVVDYLTKPIDKNRLIAKIEKALQNK